MEDRVQFKQGVCVVGGGGLTGDPHFCFTRTNHQPDSFKKAPLACSSVNGLSIVPGQNKRKNTLIRFRCQMERQEVTLQMKHTTICAHDYN